MTFDFSSCYLPIENNLLSCNFPNKDKAFVIDCAAFETKSLLILVFYLLFSFFPGLSRSPTPRQLERALDELNAGRPQCPVGLHTLIVPRKNSQNIAPEAQPMVYLKCGHVQVLFFF